MDSNSAMESFLFVVGGFLAGSGGFWVYLTNRYEKRDKRRECHIALLMGLAHDKIVFLGIRLIEKGWANKDEYDDLIKYFWEPYAALGGNGSAERIIRIVQMLPIRPELRQFPEVREIADTLHRGTEHTIERIKEGDDSLKRNEDA